MRFPMSPADALVLFAEAPERPMHVGTLALLNPPEGADAWDLREMVAAAQARERVAPLWRRRPHRSLGTLGQWYWRSDAEVDLGYHVQVSALPPPGGLAELWDLVSGLHGGLLDRSRPLWQLHLIEGLADGRYAAYIKAHHALLTGVSAMRLLQQTVSADPDRRGMPALWEVTEQTPPREAAAPVDWGDPLDAARGVLGAAGGLAGMMPALADTAWRAARRRGGPLTLAAPHTPLNVPISGARSFAGRAFPIERLRRVAKRADATVNDVVLAMCAGALRGYLAAREALPAAPLVAMVPVSVRGADPAGAPGEVPGDKIGTLMCSLATHLADPAERLAAVRTSMREGTAALAGRSQVQVLAMSALGAAPLVLAMTFGRIPAPLRPQNVTISNVPGPIGPLYWNGAHLDALYPLAAPVDGQALNIACTSTDDQIAFGLTGCRRAVPAISTLADLLDRELDVLGAAIGFKRRSRITSRRSSRLGPERPTPSK
jgi:WS/DGAT/MGAT family acyltransferase